MRRRLSARAPTPSSNTAPAAQVTPPVAWPVVGRVPPRRAARRRVRARRGRRRVRHLARRRRVHLDPHGEPVPEVVVGRVRDPFVTVEHPPRPVGGVPGGVDAGARVDERDGPVGGVRRGVGGDHVAVEVDERDGRRAPVELRLVAERHPHERCVPDAHRRDRRERQGSRRGGGRRTGDRGRRGAGDGRGRRVGVGRGGRRRLGRGGRRLRAARPGWSTVAVSSIGTGSVIPLPDDVERHRRHAERDLLALEERQRLAGGRSRRSRGPVERRGDGPRAVVAEDERDGDERVPAAARQALGSRLDVGWCADATPGATTSTPPTIAAAMTKRRPIDAMSPLPRPHCQLRGVSHAAEG